MTTINPFEFVAYSPFGFVLGNPVRLFDPDGMAPGDPIKARVAEDGIPITYSEGLTITSGEASPEWATNSIESFGNNHTINNDPLRKIADGTGSGIATIQIDLEDAETFADILGTSEIPGVSQVADLTAAAIAAGQGDFEGALLSLAGFIPAVGAIFNGAKWARRLNKLQKRIRREMSFRLVTRGGNTLSQTTYRNTNYRIYRSHAFDRPHTVPNSGGVVNDFATTSLTPGRIESKIIRKLHPLRLPVLSGRGSVPYTGITKVGGHRIEFTAGKLPNGDVIISNYYLK